MLDLDPNFPWMPLLERLLVSLLCGAAIGLEREWAGKSAGLRTITLICMGSALYMSVSVLAAQQSDRPLDLTRIAAQVASGIGFLGAGTIIVARGQVHGLTTAATIWVVAAIGLLVGAGYPIFAMLATSMVLGILILIGYFERIFLDRWLGTRNGGGLRKRDLDEPEGDPNR
jgi:putative Mg2+ transporter-C (MgtC) family protein